MKTLWIVVLVLGLVYFVVWSVERATDQPKDQRAPAATANDTSPAGLAEVAKGDAVGRLDAGAQIEVQSVKPLLVAGSELKSASIGTPGATTGAEVIIIGKVENKQVAKFTYHVAPPRRAVLQKEER